MKPRPYMRPCRRTRYATAELAQAALVKARQGGARRWYWCEKCRGFHLETRGAPCL